MQVLVFFVLVKYSNFIAVIGWLIYYMVLRYMLRLPENVRISCKRAVMFFLSEDKTWSLHTSTIKKLYNHALTIECSKILI